MAAEHEIQLYADTEAPARRAADAAIADIVRIEAKYSRYRDDTVVTQINRAAGSAPVPIDAETHALLRYADHCFRLSEGRFDITSGVLRRVWDFAAQRPRVPSPESLAAARGLIGWGRVEWDANAIRLPQIGIRDPRAPDSAVAAIDVVDGAVATSGDYERYFDLGGRRYCHVLNPRTGMPVEHWRSVSVVAPLCVVAGTCATIAMLLEDRAIEFLDAQRLDYLGIDRAGNLYRRAIEAST